MCVCAGEAVRERGGVQTLLDAVSLPSLLAGTPLPPREKVGNGVPAP